MSHAPASRDAGVNDPEVKGDETGLLTGTLGIQRRVPLR